MDTLPLAEVKNHLSEYVDRVASQRDRITITRNGRPAAVLINPDELEGLEETLDILSSPGELDAINAAMAEIDAGQGIGLHDVKAALDNNSAV